MPDGVTQQQFFERIRQLEEKIDLRHSSLRTSMEDHFLRLELAMSKHEDEDQAVEKRVTKLEVASDAAREAAVHRSALISAIVAPSCIAAWETIKHMAGWK